VNAALSRASGEAISESDAATCVWAVDMTQAIVLMAAHPITGALAMLQHRSAVGGSSTLDILQFILREISTVVHATHQSLGTYGPEMGSLGKCFPEQGTRTSSLWHAVVGAVKNADEEGLLYESEAATLIAAVKATRSILLVAAQAITTTLDMLQLQLDEVRDHRALFGPAEFKKKEEALRSLQSSLRDITAVVVETYCLGSSDLFLPAAKYLATTSTNLNFSSQLQNAFAKLQRRREEGSKPVPRVPSAASVAYVPVPTTLDLATPDMEPLQPAKAGATLLVAAPTDPCFTQVSSNMTRA